MHTLFTLVVSLTLNVPDATIEKWLDRTRQLESGGRHTAIGDGGRSRGPYQIQQGTWKQFGGRGNWRTAAHDEKEARRVARRYIHRAIQECRRRGWAVNFRNVRHLYRYGLYTRVSPR